MNDNEKHILFLQDSQSTGELKPLLHEPLGGKQKKLQLDGPVADSGSISISSSDDIKVSREDIELVKYLSFKSNIYFVTMIEFFKIYYG